MKNRTSEDSRPVSSFYTRQVSFLVEHEPGMETEQVYGALNEWLSQQEVTVNMRVDRTTRYQEQDGAATSVFYGELESSGDGEEERDIERTLTFIDVSNRRLTGEPIAGIRVSQVSPNWLLTGAQSHATVGGPGTDPVPVDDDPDSRAQTTGRRPYEFWFASAPGGEPPGCLAQLLALLGISPPAPITAPNPVMQAWERRQNAQPVAVYVLDSAPSAEQLRQADIRWPTHPLLSNRAEWLEIHYYDKVSPSTVDQFKALTEHATGFSLDGRPNTDYSDHGLFVAGIIHSIAPRAKVHLIEVLNKYAVGTEEILNHGIEYALQHSGEGGALIVNASLMLAAPHQGAHPRMSPAEQNWLKRNQRGGLLDEAVTRGLSRGFEAIGRRGATIAAAGNDNTDPNNRPAARYPARYSTVTGISALNRTGGFASYSNLADDPLTRGLAAFGGDIGDGLLGVYTGAFPNGAPNTNGWARWAGTSFAAPVISGLVAILCGQGHSPTNAISALWDLEIEPTPNPVRTHTVSIKQG